MGVLRSRFVQAILILVLSFVGFRYGIQLLSWLLVGVPAPAPWSVVTSLRRETATGAGACEAVVKGGLALGGNATALTGGSRGASD